MGDTERPRIAISSCLLGVPVRYNGGHSRDRFLDDTLSQHVDWIPICPEMEIGLGAPRDALRLEDSEGGPHLVTRRTGQDHTEPMNALATSRIPRLDADGYVFKAKSPSCGVRGVTLHRGGTVVDHKHRGLFAAAVMDAHPLLPVEDEGRLHDPVLREAFVERVFAHARLRALLEGDWLPRDLMAFQARHKMQIMSHASYQETGRLAAASGTRPREPLATEYAEAFKSALTHRTSVGRHVNALQHCLGMLDLDHVLRDDLLDVIESYRARRVALSVPMALLRHHARRAEAAYLAEQTYFRPYPDELALRNHVTP
ncbi:YbgA family protein [Nonomuraea sp. LPB2021202275-12-8]|uniref:YbgA family protein n=1 Tax=Nonomuraea sp. LPB2021202275-12-8 TaxID=3120159 RepID=UPI00300D6B32